MSLNVLTQGGGTGGASASIFVTGLSETDVVTAVKDGKTVRGKWVRKVNPECVLPSGYTQLEYIQSNGDQYINSGLPASDDMRIEATAYKADRADGTSFLGGDTGKPYGCALYGRSEVMQLFCGQTGDISIGTIPYGEWFDFDITIKNGSISAVWDGASKAGTYSGNVGTSTNFFVFSGGNGVEKTTGLRYKRFKWTRNGSLVRDYISAKRNSDNAVGMYDLANDVFYPNAGTGEFIAGEEVPPYINVHEITIKGYGMWSVTATNGEETTTQDVLVDAAVEYEIPMSYILWLYREGDECKEVTGGWIQTDGSNYATFEKTDTTLKLHISGGGSWIGAKTANAIDFGSRDSLHFEYTAVSSGTYSNGVLYQLGLMNGDRFTDAQGTVKNFSGVTTLGLSEVSSPDNVLAYVEGGGSAVANNRYLTVEISKIWAE